ncbi:MULTISPECIES: colicin immunity protein [Eikenella]|uniref:Colicin immunity protein n=1 Tax=Eikenella longinqua TaxID=1795827 RepID=A0A1A9RXB7_9NEIS|nr:MULTISPECIES: colicin immunity protein [Eikenella]OAM29382.1 colicin immunity protein [Eikenella longinqua]
MTRTELIRLGERILAAEDDEALLEDLMAQFDRHVPHPEGSSLFFYPAGWNARSGSLADYAPTAEEVVDACLAYRPVCL